MNSLDWTDVTNVIDSYWPSWTELPKPIQDLWKTELIEQPKHRVLEALRRVVTNKSSRIPQIAWVLKEIRAIKTAASSKEYRPGFHVSQAEYDQIQRERQEILEELEALPRRNLSRAVNAVLALGTAPDRPARGKKSLSRDISQWGERFRGLVWAAAKANGAFDGPQATKHRQEDGARLVQVSP